MVREFTFFISEFKPLLGSFGDQYTEEITVNYQYDDLLFGSDENDTEILMELEDIVHMKDVKDVYTMLRLMALGALIIAVSLSFYLYKKDKNSLITGLNFYTDDFKETPLQS